VYVTSPPEVDVCSVKSFFGKLTFSLLIGLGFESVSTSVPFLPDRVYAPVALTPFDGGNVVDVVVVLVVVVLVVVVLVVVVEVAVGVVPPALAHAFGVPYETGVAPIGAAIMTLPESSVIAKYGLVGKLCRYGFTALVRICGVAGGVPPVWVL